MSFRQRVFALVALVAVIAVGATAYLAFRQAANQVNAASISQETVVQIIRNVNGYALEHGTWEGIVQTVTDLKDYTGQRIKLVTEDGVVIVDTDTLEGRAARPVNATPILIDPRPTLTLPEFPAKRPWDATIASVRRYRSGVRLAVCLTRLGIGVKVTPGDYQIPDYAPTDEARQNRPADVLRCQRQAGDDWKDSYTEDVMTCEDDFAKVPPPDRDKTQPTVNQCLQKSFNRLTFDVAPAALLAYLGAIDDPRPTLTPTPVIAAAVLVALLAIAATAVLSRRVLRPIGTLTTASQRLGEGDLTRRVPVTGRDELAQLAKTFNRMADSLQRGEERQRRLVADVAHELRTPLANLRGYLEALKDGVIPPDPALFASLHEEAVLQQRIVDDLQDLALAEAGTLAYHRTDVDLAELLEICHIAHQAAADTAAVTLEVRSEPLTVHADPDRLRQVIGNLVTNALRATPAGGSVTLSARGSAGRAVVEVRDTGAGIAAEDLPHVFDRFWRADPARARGTGGSGLGLAIARQIVTDHGGTIAIASVPGSGTVVTISLPGTGATTGS